MSVDENSNVADEIAHESDGGAGAHEAPGTMMLTFIFLITFVVYYFANWKALADVWEVR